MNKWFKIFVIPGMLVLAMAFVALAAFSNIKNASKSVESSLPVIKKDNESDLDVTNDHSVPYENDEIVFHSIEEYDKYLLSQSSPKKGDTQSSEITSYYLPESLPDDAELVSIVVSVSGTVFTYQLDRPFELSNFETDSYSSNLILMDSTDTTLNALFQTIRYKIVKTDNILSSRTYASHFADDIGAVPVTDECDYYKDIYKGTLYAASNIANKHYMVGTQYVSWTATRDQSDVIDKDRPGSILYYYCPQTLSASEIDGLLSVVEHNVGS